MGEGKQDFRQMEAPGVTGDGSGGPVPGFRGGRKKWKERRDAVGASLVQTLTLSKGGLSVTDVQRRLKPSGFSGFWQVEFPVHPAGVFR
jgi:hypothetical protein